jgi:hypothetical protein
MPGNTGQATAAEFRQLRAHAKRRHDLIDYLHQLARTEAGPRSGSVWGWIRRPAGSLKAVIRPSVDSRVT